VAGSIGGMAFSGTSDDMSVDSTRNGDDVLREVVWNSSLFWIDEWYCFLPLREFVLTNIGVGRGNGSASHDVELVAIGD